MTLPKNQLFLVNFVDAFDAFVEGKCNVLVAPDSEMHKLKNILIDLGKPVDDFLVSPVSTVDGAALATREDDGQWSDSVFWALQALQTAEAHGFTQESFVNGSAALRQTDAFGEDCKDVFNDAVAAVGNFGEFMVKHDENAFPRRSYNQMNNGKTGIIKSHPLGVVGTEGPGPFPGGTIASVQEKGKLFCAVQSKHPGFAEDTVNATGWHGMDIDCCRAVNAAMFGLGEENLGLVKVGGDEEGFKLLQNGDIDLCAGVMVTMERDVREPSTGTGFAFSRPCFYNVSAILNKQVGAECRQCTAIAF